jgi:hypothetical protein
MVPGRPARVLRLCGDDLPLTRQPAFCWWPRCVSGHSSVCGSATKRVKRNSAGGRNSSTTVVVPPTPVEGTRSHDGAWNAMTLARQIPSYFAILVSFQPHALRPRGSVDGLHSGLNLSGRSRYGSSVDGDYRHSDSQGGRRALGLTTRWPLSESYVCSGRRLRTNVRYPSNPLSPSYGCKVRFVICARYAAADLTVIAPASVSLATSVLARLAACVVYESLRLTRIRRAMCIRCAPACRAVNFFVATS